MGRTSENIKLEKPENPSKIKGFRRRSYREATTISSQPRYDHFDTSPYMSTLKSWKTSTIRFVGASAESAALYQTICSKSISCKLLCYYIIFVPIFQDQTIIFFKKRKKCIVQSSKEPRKSHYYLIFMLLYC